MAITRQPTGDYSEQRISNNSFDKEFQTSVVQPLGYDGANLQRANADNLAVKITSSGTATYIGQSAPGTAEATTKWQCMKYDTSTGKLTYADGNANFDNAATDLTALTYS